MWPRQCGAKGKDHLSWHARDALSNRGCDAIGCFCCERVTEIFALCFNFCFAFCSAQIPFFPVAVQSDYSSFLLNLSRKLNRICGGGRREIFHYFKTNLAGKKS